MPIKGKKVFLKGVEKESLEQLRTWRNRPELRKYFREYREINKAMQNDWFTHRVCDNKNEVNFEIHEKGGGKLIGHCGLFYISWINRHAEFGIYIGDDEYRNGGYGSDALRTLIGYGFNDLNLNKIWCEVFSNNVALDVYEHIGFKKEGVLRQNYFNEGKYWDSIVMSMLKEEYENREI